MLSQMTFAEKNEFFQEENGQVAKVACQGDIFLSMLPESSTASLIWKAPQ
jgi:hypothetical protein